MSKDLWHFPRTELAKQVISMFDTGLSSSLVFFAPRRMGKTEFLRKDIQPLAKRKGWETFYFSFLDAGPLVREEFTQALHDYAVSMGVIANAERIISRISKIGGKITGVGSADVEFRKQRRKVHDMKELVTRLAKYSKVLLLMDEVQVLAKDAKNERFIASLRTALDINKDNVKVIFTGSSREGLRQMFSQASAPFFHFGQNLPFPELGKEFTDHLVKIFKKATGRDLDKVTLWNTFREMDRVPQLARSLVERLALNPNYSVSETKKQLISELIHDRQFELTWGDCSSLEQLLLQEIANGTKGLFGEETRKELATKLGLNSLEVHSVQSSLRTLQRKRLVGRLPDRGGYFIDDPNFKSWLNNV